MADNQTENIQPLSSVPRQVQRAVLASIAVFFVVSLSAIYLWSWIAEDPELEPRLHLASQAEAAELRVLSSSRKGGSATVGTLGNAPSSPISSIQLQQDALLQARLIRLRGQGQRIRAQCEALGVSSEKLTLSLASLQQDELGRRIGANSELVRQFETIQQNLRPPREKIEQLGDELYALIQPLEVIQADTIQENFVQRLVEIGAEIRDKQEIISRDQRLLDALLDVTKTQPPGTEKLASVLDDRAQEQTQHHLETITQAADAARQKELTKLTNEAVQRGQAIVQAQHQLKQVQDEKRLATLQSQIADTQQAAQAAEKRSDLERDFRRDEREIMSLLRPFITHGMMQPYRRSYRAAAEKGPVSLDKLQASGALAPNPDARKALYYITSSTGNDRDLGAFPKYIGGRSDTDSKQELMKRVQDLLHKYGELLVEKGLLAR